jgi:SAM-dependent methyltransferase
MTNSVTRFDNRVAAYVRYRPRYPVALLDCLRSDYGLGPRSTVADVGAGTGILTELLLTAGCTVYAVEPNAAMRAAMAARLNGCPGFRLVDGAAEATGLPPRGVDFVTAAQAFHWFDHAAAQTEFRRILAPGGRVALVWNHRQRGGTPFLEGYERLLQEFGIDYERVDHPFVINPEVLERFFGPRGYRRHEFPNRQVMDYEDMIGRLASTSYMPAPDDPRFPALAERARTLFDACAVQGSVTLEYKTRLYVGCAG